MRKIIGLLFFLLLAAGVIVWNIWESKKNTAEEAPEIEKIEIKQGFGLCEVCGYNAKNELDSCLNCYRKFNDEIIGNLGYQKKEFLILEQLDYFAEDTSQIPNFFAPEISAQGFPKDATWRPLIDLDKVLEWRKLNLQFLEQEAQ